MNLIIKKMMKKTNNQKNKLIKFINNNKNY